MPEAVDGIWGDMPIHYAACSGDLETARLLLRHGADVNARSSNNGATPLHYAAGKGGRDLITLLLASGGRLDILDKTGWTPYIIAGNARHNDVAQFLLALAAKK